MSENDNIERAFQDRFDSEAISDQGWNQPREKVWEKIETDLSYKKKRMFGIPFFILLTGLLISLIGNGYALSKNNNLAKQVKEIRIELDQCASKVNTIDTDRNLLSSELNNQNTSVQNLENTDAESINFEKPTSRIKNEVNSISTVEKPRKSHKVTLKSEINTQNKSDLFITNIQNTQDDVKPLKDTKSDISNKRENISSIALKNIYRGKVESNKIGKSYLSNLQITPNIKRSKAQSFISIKGGMIGSNLIKNGRQTSALTEVIDREYAKLGSLIEVKYTSKISDKWSVSGGLGINHQKFITEYDLTLPYNKSEEIIENGIGHIDFEHSLPTSFGNTDTELRLRRPDPDASTEIENVNIDFNTQHDFLFLTMPLSFDYLVNDVESGFFVGIDAVPSYIASASSSISSVVTQHNNIESVNNTSTSDYKDLKRFNLGLGAHLGYRYPINPKSGLELSASYLRNINSYFSSGNFNSTSQGIQLSAGYFFRF